MTAKNPYFWESWEQAHERIQGSYVLYGDAPAFVDVVNPPEVPGAVPTASVSLLGESRTCSKPLDDPLFHRFRKLPPVGWVNHVKQGNGVFLERRPVRSRQHGLSNNNVFVASKSAGAFSWRDYNYFNVVKDKGYPLACKKDYPGMKDVITHIRADTVIAVSPLYAILRDDNGLRWFYRNLKKVGAFFDTETLLLFNQFSYLREEIGDSPAVTVGTIKEF